MTRNWINTNPKLVFLLLGLLVGFCVTFLIRQTDDVRMQEKISEIKELKETVSKERSTVETLKEYASKLKNKTVTYKLVKPDGTIVERTSSDTETETEISEQAKSTYEKTIAETVSRIEEQYSKLTTQNKKLNINVGVTSNLDYVTSGQYNVWGPLLLGAGLEYNKSQNHKGWLTIGIKL